MAFAWSYSRYRNFKTCPRKYKEQQITKKFAEPESPKRDHGLVVHDMMAKRISKGVPLPLGSVQYEEVAADCAAQPGVIYTEHQLAITRGFQPCAWFGDAAWLRVVVDYVCIENNTAVAIDWKTGERLDTATQLELNALALFVHAPQLRGIASSFVYLDRQETKQHDEIYLPKDMPRIKDETLEKGNELEVAVATDTFPPVFNYLCRAHCPVTYCEFHGRSLRGKDEP